MTSDPSNAPSLRERVVSGVVWLTATRAFGQIITWIITIFVVRLLSPEDYGLMGMAIVFTGVLFLLNEIGLGQRSSRTPSSAPTSCRTFAG